MRTAACIALALALATTAHAQKRIGIIGDSHARGGVTNPGVGTGVSRHNVARTLSSVLSVHPGDWNGADVQDWSIPASAPEDWLTGGPSLESLCTASGEPWVCCTGEGTSNGVCACDNENLAPYYPHLKSACADRSSIVSHLPTDYDAWLLVGDIDGTVADYEALIAALEAIVAEGGVVLLSSPVHLGSSGSCALLSSFAADTQFDLDMAGLISGPDYFDFALPAVTKCPDLVHPTGVDYAWMGVQWVGSLPTPTPAP